MHAATCVRIRTSLQAEWLWKEHVGEEESKRMRFEPFKVSLSIFSPLHFAEHYCYLGYIIYFIHLRILCICMHLWLAAQTAPLHSIQRWHRQACTSASMHAHSLAHFLIAYCSAFSPLFCSLPFSFFARTSFLLESPRKPIHQIVHLCGTHWHCDYSKGVLHRD